jgi:hypothetical protein
MTDRTPPDPPLRLERTYNASRGGCLRLVMRSADGEEFGW